MRGFFVSGVLVNGSTNSVTLLVPSDRSMSLWPSSLSVALGKSTLMDLRHRRFGLPKRLGWAVVDGLPLSFLFFGRIRASSLPGVVSSSMGHQTHPHPSVAASSLGTRTRVLMLWPWVEYQYSFWLLPSLLYHWVWRAGRGLTSIRFPLSMIGRI